MMTLNAFSPEKFPDTSDHKPVARCPHKCSLWSNIMTKMACDILFSSLSIASHFFAVHFFERVVSSYVSTPHTKLVFCPFFCSAGKCAFRTRRTIRLNKSHFMQLFCIIVCCWPKTSVLIYCLTGSDHEFIGGRFLLSVAFSRPTKQVAL